MTCSANTILRKHCARFTIDQRKCAYLSKSRKINGSSTGIRKIRANMVEYIGLHFKRPVRKRFFRATKVCLMCVFGNCFLMLIKRSCFQSKIQGLNFILDTLEIQFWQQWSFRPSWILDSLAPKCFIQASSVYWWDWFYAYVVSLSSAQIFYGQRKNKLVWIKNSKNWKRVENINNWPIGKICKGISNRCWWMKRSWWRETLWT